MAKAAALQGSEKFVKRRGLVVAVVGLTLLALTLYFWKTARVSYDAQILLQTEKTLEYIQGRLKTQVETRLAMGRLMRDGWLNGLINDQPTFEAQANIVLEQFPDLQAINWVDARGIIVWVVPLEGNEAALGLDLNALKEVDVLLSDAERTGQTQLTGPRELVQGGLGIIAYVPVVQDGKTIGYVDLVSRTAPLTESAFAGADFGDIYLSIKDGDRLFAEIGDPALASSKAVVRTIRFENRTWTLSAAPRRSSEGAFKGVAAPLVLVAGLIVTVAVSWLVHLALLHHVRMRESEARFADFAGVSSDWFWESDSALRFTYFSPKMAEITGISADKMIGKTRAEVGAPGADPEAYQMMLDDMAARRPFRDFEHIRVRPDGQTVVLAISGKPVFDDRGIFVGYRGIGRDITAYRDSKYNLNAALAESERANRAKSEFLATMSHELRTPLNAVIGFSDMLYSEIFGPLGAPNYKQYAANIRDSGQHLLRLINDILDISAIEAKKRPMTLELCDVRPLIEDCARTFELQLAEKDISLEMHLDAAKTPCYVDKRSIIQIALNLISNAVKFTDPGGRVIVVATDRADGVLIKFSDNGIGIAPEHLSLLAQPFTRLNADPYVTREGSGLGLSIVQALVESHGGTFKIQSELGVGTTANVFIPRTGPSVGAGS